LWKGRKEGRFCVVLWEILGCLRGRISVLVNFWEFWAQFCGFRVKFI
jgi:hypothetical protein